MSVPAHVLLARALHALEGAQLHLTAGETDKAVTSLENGLALVREVLDR